VASLAAIDRIDAVAQRAGCSVFPVFNYRDGAGFQQFLDLAGAGRFGAPLVSTVEVGLLRGADDYEGSWRGTKAGEMGGCLASHAIHHFDMLLSALGRPTSAMALTATRVNDIETEDCAAGVLGSDSGAFASFAVTLGLVTATHKAADLGAPVEKPVSHDDDRCT
jgi:predicted dehydrogenase